MDGQALSLAHALRPALAGALVWAGLWLWPALPPEPMTAIHRVVLLAILVYVPALLAALAARGGSLPAASLGPSPADVVDETCSTPRLLADAGELPRARGLIFTHPLAAFALLTTYLCPQGPLAAALVVPWLLWTSGLALCGLTRLRTRDPHDAPALALDLGMILLPVGAGWLMLSRLGWAPLGFGDPIVTLTAVHFHYTAFVLPVVLAAAGRLVADSPGLVRFHRWVVYAIFPGIALVAVGISTTRTLELVAAAWLATALLGLCVVLARCGLDRRLAPGARAGALTAAGSLAAAMVLAVRYALGGALFPELVLTIPEMVQLHGWLNALGFAGGGTALVLWTRVGRRRGDRR